LAVLSFSFIHIHTLPFPSYFSRLWVTVIVLFGQIFLRSSFFAWCSIDLDIILLLESVALL
jgi:hypothetical protein